MSKNRSGNFHWEICCSGEFPFQSGIFQPHILRTLQFVPLPGYATADIASRELKFLAQSLAPSLRTISRFGALPLI